jgi:hypothetical protein
VKHILGSIGSKVGYVLFALGFMLPAVTQGQEAEHFDMSQLSSIPDFPQPFGYKSTWLAVRTESTKAVFDALGLSEESIANWQTGVQFSYNRDFKENIVPVFVAPPVDGWTLVLTQLGLTSESDENTAELERLLRQLSHEFGECQYFGSYRVVGYVAWYKAIDGVVMRGFSFADGSLFANSGPMSSAEFDAGLFDLTGMTENAIWQAIDSVEDKDRANVLFDEETPMKVARGWSLNPLSLGVSEGNDTATGLAGFLIK